eukprot:1153086-Pelagomonas_calceolata.AAC.4
MARLVEVSLFAYCTEWAWSFHASLADLCWPIPIILNCSKVWAAYIVPPTPRRIMWRMVSAPWSCSATTTTITTPAGSSAAVAPAGPDYVTARAAGHVIACAPAAASAGPGAVGHVMACTSSTVLVFWCFPDAARRWAGLPCPKETKQLGSHLMLFHSSELSARIIYKV